MLYQLSDDGGSDTLETLQMLAYLHAHGKPMRRVGHKVLQIGKRCMKHYYNDEDGEGDKTFKTHPESCHTTMKDSRVHTQCCEEGDGANAKAAPTLNDQKVHVPADVNTRTIAFHVQSLFLSPPPRGTFKIYGNVGMIRRDALWFARYKPDGSYPLYRTGKTAYGGPRKAQRCKGGVLDAVAPNPMPAWVEAALDDLSKRHGLPELNHVVLHRYIDGSDTIGDHHDKWLDIHPKSTIVSLSIGAARHFRLGSRTFLVSDGDVMLIPYELNRAVKHGVPKRKHAGLRYSITARSIHTFSDGVTHYVVA